MRYLFVIFISFFCGVVNAQEPKITVTLSEQQPLVGQVTTIKVKVLVPTWFSKPLYFDEVEAINIINIKGNKSTYPTSERIGSSTWTGVIKEYPVIAMAQGKFELQLPTLNIHFMSEDSQPINRKITPETVIFNATIPEKARALNPVIIAENINLTEQLKQPEKLITGQSIKRKITAEIENSSALFIPQLLTATNTDQAQAYPTTAQTADILNDRTSELLGSRVEQQDILIKQDGQFSLSAINIEYYQPSTDTIQTVAIKGQTLTVKPPAMKAKTIIWLIIGGVIALIALFYLLKLIKQLWQRYQQTEYAHYKQLKASANSDIKSYYHCYINWYGFFKDEINKQPLLLQTHQAIVISFEQALYNNASVPKNFQRELANFRQTIKHSQKADTEQLTPLNP
ncbi:BatD family protein [Colwellia sp. D2M02]|uniref:BatD family protein n=1 Tax=Colwellia sp. D2M02 TaxID=2841562 RepID=UPI001C0908E2|nr:BatD family protein [Colwellia sp. D2M02]MBU2893604.1 BatD family protein [Colwellia sp. D2M02]